MRADGPGEGAERLPYSTHMEAGFGLGGRDGSSTYLGVGKVAYYIITASLPDNYKYTHIFVDKSLRYEYPEA